MAPKIKITKEDIIKTAVDLVRGRGEGALNARAVAAALQCSTQPVFSNFATMEDLRAAVIAGAYDLYLGFLKKEAEKGEYPPYKSFGMAYIRFAKEEKELFKLLFMRDRTEEDISAVSSDFEESVQMIVRANGVSVEKARLMHMELWTCVHGIGVMLATSFMPLPWKTVSDMLSDVYQGLRIKHREEGK